MKRNLIALLTVIIICCSCGDRLYMNVELPNGETRSVPVSSEDTIGIIGEKITICYHPILFQNTRPADADWGIYNGTGYHAANDIEIPSTPLRFTDTVIAGKSNGHNFDYRFQRVRVLSIFTQKN